MGKRIFRNINKLEASLSSLLNDLTILNDAEVQSGRYRELASELMVVLETLRSSFENDSYSGGVVRRIRRDICFYHVSQSVYCLRSAFSWHLMSLGIDESAGPNSEVTPTERVNSTSGSPVLANTLLSLFARGKDREALIGDLEEEYLTYILPTHGPRYAKFWYWWHTLASIFAILVERLKGLALLGVAGKVIEWVARKIGF